MENHKTTPASIFFLSLLKQGRRPRRRFAPPPVLAASQQVASCPSASLHVASTSCRRFFFPRWHPVLAPRRPANISSRRDRRPPLDSTPTAGSCPQPPASSSLPFLAYPLYLQAINSPGRALSRHSPPLPSSICAAAHRPHVELPPRPHFPQFQHHTAFSTSPGTFPAQLPLHSLTGTWTQLQRLSSFKGPFCEKINSFLFLCGEL